MLVTCADARFADDRGEVYAALGMTIAAGPWYNFNPSSCGYQVLLRWEGKHGAGHGHIADFVGMYALSQAMADELYR
jgi:hypothetical protein